VLVVPTIVALALLGLRDKTISWPPAVNTIG